METPQGISCARAAQKLRERQILLLRFGVPDGGFERGFGHVVAANGREQVPNFDAEANSLPFSSGQR